MSGEIKLSYEETMKILADLKTSIQTVEPTSAVSVEGDNRLDTVDKLNKINQSLETLVRTYKTLLLQNEEATQQSIDTLKDTEERIANGMRIPR